MKVEPVVIFLLQEKFNVGKLSVIMYVHFDEFYHLSSEFNFFDICVYPIAVSKLYTNIKVGVI